MADSRVVTAVTRMVESYAELYSSYVDDELTLEEAYDKSISVLLKADTKSAVIAKMQKHLDSIDDSEDTEQEMANVAS